MAKDSKNAKLAELIKYDTTLGREQNIDLGKDSSLTNNEALKLKGGVKLSTFATEKHDLDFSLSIDDGEEKAENSNTDDGDAKKDDKSSQNKTSYEVKMRRRKQAEAAGLIEPRTVTNVFDGGPFKEPHRMSRLEYIKKHNNLGTIGKMIRAETMKQKEEEAFYKTLSE